MSDSDFPRVAGALLASSLSLLQEWLPNGELRGREYVVGSVAGESGQYLSINVDTGLWKDFSAGQSGGDLISLYAAIRGIKNGEACRVLDGLAQGSTPAVSVKKDKRKVIIPVPPDAPDCHCKDPEYGLPVRIFTYRTIDNGLSSYVARYEPKNDDEKRDIYKGRNKAIKPWTYGSAKGSPRWGIGSPPAPRSLYNLPDFALRPTAPVMVVEGEPAADAARTFAGGYVVTTWPHGAESWKHADWTHLHGRKVLLWPDADDAGIDAMRGIASTLAGHCPEIKLLDPGTDRKKGWDAADFVRETHGDAKTLWETFKAWAVPRLTVVTPDLIDQWRVDEKQRRQRSTAAPVVVEPPSWTGPEPAPAPTQAVAQEQAVAPTNGTSARAKVSWYEWHLDVDGKGHPVTNLNNAVTILERDEDLNDLVWYDEFLKRIFTKGADGRPREWTDSDDINLALDLQRRIGVTKIAIDTVANAVIAVAMRNVKNCVRDWIDGLTWDGVPRIDNFFEDEFDAEGPTEYLRAASKNFWLSIVARVYRPGCKVDNVVVLEGLKQGEGKSTALQIIGGEWYTEQHESAMNPKAFFEVIQGALITEIAEMDSFARAEQAKVKAVITSRFDRFRESYGRHAAFHFRQGIFVCTTNEESWDRNPRGERRWWPIRCGVINVESIRANREQLFAEARTRLNPTGEWHESRMHFAGGETWWEMPGDATRAEQAARYESDPWAPAIEDYVKGRISFNMADMLKVALNIDISDVRIGEQRRVGNTLRYLGWENRLERVDGKPMKVWRRIEDR